MRVRQLEAMFDVPPTDKAKLHWSGDFPIEERPWSIGLIVGPSGCGKSKILEHVFGRPASFEWNGASVIDDFRESLPIGDVAAACQSVGFNTIPAWLRPFAVLSNGEKFRADIARRLLELEGDVIVDEFTSVVDRQVAQITSHAVQKHVRRAGRRFIAASCHYDIEDWLQPDWVLEPATMTFRWRSLQRRPVIDCEVVRIDYAAWRAFAPFHYLTADLHRAARCFGLYANGTLAAFAGMLHRPHPRSKDIMGCARLVTLPDFQGIGLAMALIDALGAAYRAIGKRAHTYPAHPALIRTFDKSPHWACTQKPGFQSRSSASTRTSTLKAGNNGPTGRMGARPSATFEFVGPAMERRDAERMLA